MSFVRVFSILGGKTLTIQHLYRQRITQPKNQTLMRSKQLNTSSQPYQCSVDQMAANSSGTVIGLIEPLGVGGELGLVRRLAELGFLPGESVTVLRRGPGGREPIAVQIGETVFALRSIEASCIEINRQLMTEPA